MRPIDVVTLVRLRLTVPAVPVALVLVALSMGGCTQDAVPGPPVSSYSPDRPARPALQVVGTRGSRDRLFNDCTSIPDQSFQTPKLLWFTIRVARPVTVQPLEWGSSSTVTQVRQWTAPPVTGAAPRSAVVDGGRPSARRLSYFEAAIGDQDPGHTDHAPVEEAWQSREALARPRRLAPGEHLFVVRMDVARLSGINGLTLVWRAEGGSPQRREIGSIRFRGLCGG